MRAFTSTCILLLGAALAGCAHTAKPEAKKVDDKAPLPLDAHFQPATPAQIEAASKAVGADPAEMAALEARPLYTFNEKEVGQYLPFVQQIEPDLGRRIVRLGRKEIGQPYELYLLGEAPFEQFDPQPLYCLDRSDCVVFSEHMYAMALSNDWPTFFTTLQRIRYHEGKIGVATRNHYTEADWDKANTWLVKDVTEELAGDKVKHISQTVNRQKFLKGRYKIDRDIPVEKVDVTYIVKEDVPGILSQLHNGDFVNVMSGKGDDRYASHVGLIAIQDDGTVDFLHSSEPRVKEQPLLDFIEKTTARNDEKQGKADAARDKAAPKAKTKAEAEAVQKQWEKDRPTRLWGFKFLRLQQDPIANLKKIDGPGAPKISSPEGKLTFAGN
ncbi:hypothetical protein BH09SUM1_BH09SUM1_20250 [soil metagenome]